MLYYYGANNNERDIAAFFGNVGYMSDLAEDITDDEVIGVAKSMNEVAIYNAIKKNKAFKKAIDNLMYLMTENLEKVATDGKKCILQDRKYEEQNRKRDEAYAKKQKEQAEKAAAKQKIEAEKAKKSHAEKLIFNECLSSDQKKALKKFYSLDIDRQFHPHND